MAKQLHKKFSDDQIRELLERYLDKKIKRTDIQKVLRIGKTRFFKLLRDYRDNPVGFSIEYVRKNATNKIAPGVEENIMTELKAEKRLIQDPEVPARTYNYIYIKDRLAQDRGQKVALSTIISRAKAYGYYQKKRQKKYHDREVATNYAGELV